MDVCPDADVGLGEGKPKTGVAMDSVTTGDVDEEGVEACSVANRSGVGEETGVKIPHPRMKISAVVIHKSFVLFIIQVD
jgi:hypothetical protein